MHTDKDLLVKGIKTLVYTALLMFTAPVADCWHNTFHIIRCSWLFWNKENSRCCLWQEKKN